MELCICRECGMTIFKRKPKLCPYCKRELKYKDKEIVNVCVV